MIEVTFAAIYLCAIIGLIALLASFFLGLFAGYGKRGNASRAALTNQYELGWDDGYEQACADAEVLWPERHGSQS